MTITYKIGNILDAEENFICQQVNYMGKMSSGLAKQIREKWPGIYKDYLGFIKEFSWERIKNDGRVYCYKIKDNKFILNIFGQKYYGKDKCYTDYESLKNSFMTIREILEDLENNYSLSIPDHLGCGLAGGDWSIVHKIIKDIFENSNINVVIYKLKEE